MPKNKGGLFNIAVDVHDICNSLPRISRSSRIILAKLLALPFNGHACFEPLFTQMVLHDHIYLQKLQ